MCHILHTVELFCFCFMNAKILPAGSSPEVAKLHCRKEEQKHGSWPYRFTHKLSWLQASLELKRCSEARSYCHHFSNLPELKICLSEIELCNHSYTNAWLAKIHRTSVSLQQLFRRFAVWFHFLNLIGIKGTQHLAGLAPLYFSNDEGAKMLKQERKKRSREGTVKR